MPPGRKLTPTPITAGLTVQQLVDHHLMAYNAGRLREACLIFANKILSSEDVTVGLTISGAMTPAGLGYATAMFDDPSEDLDTAQRRNLACHAAVSGRRQHDRPHGRALDAVHA